MKVAKRTDYTECPTCHENSYTLIEKIEIDVDVDIVQEIYNQHKMDTLPKLRTVKAIREKYKEIDLHEAVLIFRQLEKDEI